MDLFSCQCKYIKLFTNYQNFDLFSVQIYFWLKIEIYALVSKLSLHSHHNISDQNCKKIVAWTKKSLILHIDETGDFGLAKMLTSDDLASSVRNSTLQFLFTKNSIINKDLVFNLLVLLHIKVEHFVIHFWCLAIVF